MGGEMRLVFIEAFEVLESHLEVLALRLGGVLAVMDDRLALGLRRLVTSPDQILQVIICRRVRDHLPSARFHGLIEVFLVRVVRLSFRESRVSSLIVHDSCSLAGFG